MQNSPTRNRLIEAAMQQIHVKGYTATSIAEVLQTAGVNSGSLYYFFKSKEELLLAILSRYEELLWPLIIEPVFEKVDDPVERIFSILGWYRQTLVLAGFTRGCPVGNLALEVGDTNGKAREKISGIFTAWRGWVRRCLDDAAERLPSDLDREQLAALVLTVMEGAIMQARIGRSLEPFEASVAQLRNYFNLLEVHR